VHLLYQKYGQLVLRKHGIVDPDSNCENIRNPQKISGSAVKKELYLTETQEIYRMPKKCCPNSLVYSKGKINNTSWA